MPVPEPTPTGGHAAHAGPIRIGEVGLHVLTGALLLVSVVRAVTDLGAGWRLLATVAGALCFATWYTVGVLRLRPLSTGRGPLAWFAGLVVLWAASVAVSDEFMWLAFPLWLLAGHLLRLVPAVLVSLAIYALVGLAPVLHEGTTTYPALVGPLVGGVFALGIARGYASLLADARERQRLIDSLVAAQAEAADLADELARTQRRSGVIQERTRISRDLHDTVAQGLSSVLLLSRAARRGDPAGSADVLARIEQQAGENLVDVRRIVAELAPADLDEAALPGALRRMLDRLAEETGAATELHVEDGLPALPTTVEVALLRTAQSALANVRRHAGASRVVLHLEVAGETVRLDVVDDGCGFDPQGWQHGADGSFGLVGTLTRLRELGGGLDVESRPGDGTALSAHVPLVAAP